VSFAFGINLSRGYFIYVFAHLTFTQSNAICRKNFTAVPTERKSFILLTGEKPQMLI